MMSALHLGEAFAFSTAVILAFAFLRSLMRAKSVPAVLDSDVLAFFLAIMLTLLLMISMLALGYTLIPLVKSPTLAFVATLVTHVALWTILRSLIPVRNAAEVVGRDISSGPHATDAL